MTNIAFTHKTNQRSRRLTLKVDTSGEVIVTTPKRTPQRLIDEFVAKNSSWIQTQRKKLSQIPQPITDSSVQIFGKNYQKQVQFSQTLPIGIKVIGEKIIANPADSKTKSWGPSENRLLKQYLKSNAEKYITAKTNLLGEKMGIGFNRITLKEQKTRWGSCSSKGNLNFNWRLVHYQPEIIDYVIIHELAHRRHMDHSQRFWSLVAKYDPEHRKHRGFLKRQGMAVG